METDPLRTVVTFLGAALGFSFGGIILNAFLLTIVGSGLLLASASLVSRRWRGG